MIAMLQLYEFRSIYCKNYATVQFCEIHHQYPRQAQQEELGSNKPLSPRLDIVEANFNSPNE